MVITQYLYHQYVFELPRPWKTDCHFLFLYQVCILAVIWIGNARIEYIFRSRTVEKAQKFQSQPELSVKF